LRAFAAKTALSFDSAGKKTRASGKHLMGELILTLPTRRSSELVHYRWVPSE
jgi:hypothetical protein